MLLLFLKRTSKKGQSISNSLLLCGRRSYYRANFMRISYKDHRKLLLFAVGGAISPVSFRMASNKRHGNFLLLWHAGAEAMEVQDNLENEGPRAPGVAYILSCPLKPGGLFHEEFQRVTQVVACSIDPTRL